MSSHSTLCFNGATICIFIVFVFVFVFVFAPVQSVGPHQQFVFVFVFVFLFAPVQSECPQILPPVTMGPLTLAFFLDLEEIRNQKYFEKFKDFGVKRIMVLKLL